MWTLSWLAPSETFIRNQTDALSRWSPVPMGLWRTESCLTRSSDTALYAPAALNRLTKLGHTIGFSPRVEKAVARAAPDVIHAQFGYSAWPVLRAAHKAGVPLVVTLHGLDISALTRQRGWRGHSYRWRLRKVFKRAAVIVAVSTFIRDEALRHGAPPERTVVHHVGVPTRDVRPERKDIDVLFVGRLTEKKGVADLFDALEQVQRAGFDRFVVVGSGPMEQQLRQKAAALGLGVEFTGLLDPAQVDEHMAKARLLAVPSHTAASGDAEGFGMVVLEAGLHEVPAVGYRHGGLVEAVVDGVTGLLVPERDTNALASAMVELLEDDVRREQLGRAARLRVLREFDIEQQSALLEELYDQAVGISRRGSSRRGSS